MKLQVRGDKIRSKVVGISDGSRCNQKTSVNIITIKVEKINLEVGGFESREEKIGGKIGWYQKQEKIIFRSRSEWTRSRAR